MFHAPLLTTRNNWNLNQWHKSQRGQNHTSMYAQGNEKHLKKLLLFDSEAMSKAWTIRQSTSLKYNKKHIRFSFDEEQMEKSGCTFKNYSLFPCFQTAAVSSVHVHALENRMQTFWHRGKELLFSCVRLDNMKKRKWGKYCKKRAYESRMLTYSMQLVFLVVSFTERCCKVWLYSTANQRQTDRRTGGTRLPHRLSVSRGRPSGTSDITHQEPITRLQ